MCASRALLGMRGVSGTLISDEWVFNHFKWIVWKLAALEVALPDSFAARSVFMRTDYLVADYSFLIHYCDVLMRT